MFNKTIVRPSSYDSLLEIPNGTNPNQNAWLTVELKVALNFADAFNRVSGLIVEGTDIGCPGRWFAKDADEWMFPAVDWTPFAKQAFLRGFQQQGERTWNYQFVLITPSAYSELDFADNKGGWMIRPNVICLFRLHIVQPGTTVLASKTISGNLSPHLTINVVRLPSDVATVRRLTRPVKDWDTRFQKPVGVVKGPSWRSNSGNYDDMDLLKPAHNTIGHEIGHALGEGHIKCLGSNPLPICATDPNAPVTYGTVAGANDADNLMGGGNQLTTINATPWTDRILDHTGIYFNPTTAAVSTPPRRLRALAGTA